MADFSFSSITDSFNSAKESLKSTGESIGNAIESAGKDNKFVNSALNIIDPGKARLAVAGLLKGGVKSEQRNTTAPNIQFAAGNADWRIKISLANSADYFYQGNNPGIMAPLIQSGGVIFPYTPQISVTHAARYGSQNLTHSNYTNYFYEGSEVQAITISGDFTVQDPQEGAYLLAAIYFFRSATKMFFGQGSKVGNPPPMVYLNGYGSHYFPNVPCVVTNFQHSLPQDVDYLEVPTSGGQTVAENDGRRSTNTLTTRVPTTSTISISLQPIYTRKNLYDNFNLEDFAAGKLINGKGGYI
jgi:hypothetical protein